MNVPSRGSRAWTNLGHVAEIRWANRNFGPLANSTLISNIARDIARKSNNEDTLKMLWTHVIYKWFESRNNTTSYELFKYSGACRALMENENAPRDFLRSVGYIVLGVMKQTDDKVGAYHQLIQIWKHPNFPDEITEDERVEAKALAYSGNTNAIKQFIMGTTMHD